VRQNPFAPLPYTLKQIIDQPGKLATVEGKPLVKRSRQECCAAEIDSGTDPYQEAFRYLAR
jgi:hypothetical protein